MTPDRHLSEKALYRLNAAIDDVFKRLEMSRLYGPADRYGVVEWAATVDDVSRFLPDSLATRGVVVSAAIAAWPDDGSSRVDRDNSAVVQVSVAASTAAFLSRWPFAPQVVATLETESETAEILGTALADSLASSRTASAALAVVSPEDAPSDMTVLPLMANRVRPS